MRLYAPKAVRTGIWLGEREKRLTSMTANAASSTSSSEKNDGITHNLDVVLQICSLLVGQRWLRRIQRHSMIGY